MIAKLISVSVIRGQSHLKNIYLESQTVSCSKHYCSCHQWEKDVFDDSLHIHTHHILKGQVTQMTKISISKYCMILNTHFKMYMFLVSSFFSSSSIALFKWCVHILVFLLLLLLQSLPLWEQLKWINSRKCTHTYCLIIKQNVWRLCAPQIKLIFISFVLK